MMKGFLHLAVFSLVSSFVMLAGVVDPAGATSLASPRFRKGWINFAAWTEDSPGRPSVKPGVYQINGGIVYVGIEAEPPDRPVVQFFDEKTRRTGSLEHISGHKYRTKDSPTMTFLLDSPISPIVEKPFVISNGADHLGASLWLTPGAGKHPTIVLVHGADDETREMGFLIPYFVSFGFNVVTYDQRGTGESTGNWQFTGPESKADDVIAIIQLIKGDPAVDPERIGVWGFSNGGWVAPIVATRSSVAFMILKSAPSESIAENVLYEIGQDLREHNQFTPEQIAAALAFERTMLLALETDSNWSAAGEALEAAKKQSWFPAMRIPPGMTTPPPPPMLVALRAALIYDPTATLQLVRAPTFAVFGALDKNVDPEDSPARLRNAFDRSGFEGLTVLILPGAGHTLEKSMTGYEDEPSVPRQTIKGYPEAIIDWLHVCGFARNGISQ